MDLDLWNDMLMLGAAGSWTTPPNPGPFTRLSCLHVVSNSPFRKVFNRFPQPNHPHTHDAEDLLRRFTATLSQLSYTSYTFENSKVLISPVDLINGLGLSPYP